MKVVIWILYIMIYAKGTMEICQLSDKETHQQYYNGYYDPARRCLSESRCAIWCNNWNRDSLLKLLPREGYYGTKAVYSNLTISNEDLAVLPDIFHGEEVRDSGYRYRIHVISLILDDTGLQEISAGAFSFFTKSSEVHLRNNRLTSITSGVFDPLISLVLLDLSYNELNFIDDSAFKYNKKLSFLYLNNNKLISVPQTQMSLIVLDISNNSPQDFDTFSLKSESHVQTLNLSRLNINESMVDFTPNLELRQLILHHNAFTALDENIFCNMSQIFKMDFCYNKIDSLKEDFFRNLINLKFLHLRNNKLSKIDARVFSQNNKIITLDLSENMIVTIEPSAFENLTKLEILNLDNNHIKILPDILYNQNSLKQLTLTYNPFEVLPLYRTWHFPQLQDLNLTGLRLDFQAAHFSLLSEIFENIDLSNNTVTIIDSEMFANLSHLALLDMSYNLLFSIDKQAFEGLSSLKTLKLQGNNLKSISSHLFNNNHLLNHLNLSYNKFSNFSTGVFDSCRDLTILDLSFNKITTITKFTFHRQINLETLYLDNNNLSTLEGIYYLKNLRSISIENNNWECHYLFNLLQQLDLSGISVVGTDTSDYPKEHVRQIACHQNETHTTENVEHIYIKSSDNFKTLRKYMLRIFGDINDNLKNISQILEKSEHASHLDQFALPSNEGVKSASNQTFSVDLGKEEEKEDRNDIKTCLYVLIVFGLCILGISVMNLYYKIKKLRRNEQIPSC